METTRFVQVQLRCIYRPSPSPNSTDRPCLPFVLVTIRMPPVAKAVCLTSCLLLPLGNQIITLLSRLPSVLRSSSVVPIAKPRCQRPLYAHRKSKRHVEGQFRTKATTGFTENRRNSGKSGTRLQTFTKTVHDFIEINIFVLKSPHRNVK